MSNIGEPRLVEKKTRPRVDLRMKDKQMYIKKRRDPGVRMTEGQRPYKSKAIKNEESEKTMVNKLSGLRIGEDSMKIESDVSIGSLMGRPAPYFRGEAIADEEFVEISLDQYAGKYLLLLFYPMDFSYICPSDIIAFSARASEFRALNCEILSCSTDSSYSHLAWIQTPRKRGGVGKVKFPLLSDKSQKISKDYGVFFREKGYAMRATFIIDTKGIIRHIMIYDTLMGRSVNETLRIVKGNQYIDTDESGCQSEWQSGMEGVELSPKGSLKYFSTQH